MCDATDVKENGTFSDVARTMGESSVGEFAQSLPLTRSDCRSFIPPKRCLDTNLCLRVDSAWSGAEIVALQCMYYVFG
jgi:hypothetical protein